MSTIVQPLERPAGQAVRPFGGGGGPAGFLTVGSGAVGSVAVFPVVGGAVDGSATGTVGDVAANVEPEFAFVFPVSRIDAVAPAAATSRVSSDTQIQSPGYQPRRRTHRRRSEGTVPVTEGRRSPHSTQYSWSGWRGAPQRGQVSSAAATAVSRSCEVVDMSRVLGAGGLDHRLLRAAVRRLCAERPAAIRAEVRAAQDRDAALAARGAPARVQEVLD